MNPPVFETLRRVERPRSGRPGCSSSLPLMPGKTADRPAESVARWKKQPPRGPPGWTTAGGSGWWKPGQSLGLKCRIIDCTFDQMAEIARDGGRLITRGGEERRWKAIGDHRGRSFPPAATAEGSQSVVGGPAEVARAAGTATSATTSCGAWSSSHGCRSKSSHTIEADSRTPLGRLRKLLRPRSG